MELLDYIGYSLNDVLPILKSSGIEYKLLEVKNTKDIRIGEDLRIINIKMEKEPLIYVAYF